MQNNEIGIPTKITGGEAIFRELHDALLAPIGEPELRVILEDLASGFRAKIHTSLNTGTEHEIDAVNVVVILASALASLTVTADLFARLEPILTKFSEVSALEKLHTLE